MVHAIRHQGMDRSRLAGILVATLMVVVPFTDPAAQTFDDSAVARWTDPFWAGRPDEVLRRLREELAKPDPHPFAMQAWVQMHLMRDALDAIEGDHAEVARLRRAGRHTEVVARYAEGALAGPSDPFLLSEIQRSAESAGRVELSDRPLTIQIYTADPAFPWELMRIPGEGPAFLGARHAVARWHLSDAGGQLERPPQEAPVGALQVIAPEYAADRRLPGRETELAALGAQSRSVQMLPTATQDLLATLATRDAPFVHFIGHGHVATAGGVADYFVDLEDGRLDHLTWRGLVERIVARGGARPFLFLNACEVGQQGVSAGFVDGWAPATLEAGGSGFIGALWPVDDTGAAAVSGRFYAEVAPARTGGRVSEALRRIRADFAESGDPTVLAYVYYGDARLRLTESGRP